MALTTTRVSSPRGFTVPGTHVTARMNGEGELELKIQTLPEGERRVAMWADRNDRSKTGKMWLSESEFATDLHYCRKTPTTISSPGCRRANFTHGFELFGGHDTAAYAANRKAEVALQSLFVGANRAAAGAIKPPTVREVAAARVFASDTLQSAYSALCLIPEARIPSDDEQGFYGRFVRQFSAAVAMLEDAEDTFLSRQLSRQLAEITSLPSEGEVSVQRMHETVERAQDILETVWAPVSGVAARFGALRAPGE